MRFNTTTIISRRAIAKPGWKPPHEPNDRAARRRANTAEATSTIVVTLGGSQPKRPEASAVTGDGCPFCAAAAGDGLTVIVYEDDATLAMFPLRPAATGHTLVLPRRHVPDLWALDPRDVAPLGAAVLIVARAIRRALKPDGLNVITSAGAAATQTVPHLHVHLVPRWHGDSFGNIWPHPDPSFAAGEIEDAAAAIRAAVDAT